MKRLITVAFFIATQISIFSCTKHGDAEPEDNPSYTDGKGGGREDDDKPIVMHKLVNEQQQPVQGVDIMMTNGLDTLRGVTDTAGRASFHLSGFGQWEGHMSYQGYLPIDTTFDVRGLFRLTTITIHQQ